MKQRIKLMMTLLLPLIPVALTAQSTTINNERAQIQFRFVEDDVDGSFSDFKFTGSIDATAFESSQISGSVAMETIDTNNWLRNRHLRAKKYFHAKEYPLLHFESNTVVPTQSLGVYQLKGTFTIKGISKEVTLKLKNDIQGIKIEGILNAADFSIEIHKEYKENLVEISIWLPYR